MNQDITAEEERHMGRVKRLKCVICKRLPDLDRGLKTEVHHVGEGSSRQNNWMVAPLCGSKADGGHHRGAGGLHHMGTKAFISLYKVPHGSEYGLLAWTNEDLQEALKGAV